jgi:REP element-mobilizing transposase RayT
MARKPRIEYAGAVYHVMSRGDRQNDLYRDNRDRECFLDTLGEACKRNGWLIHSYVLMSNHYHLLLETPEPNLVVGMKWLQGTYTQRFNSRYKETGHLFQGRYKALVVQSNGGGYFPAVATYIHLNPVRARLMDFARQDLTEFRWSSYPLYFDRSKRPDWLYVDRVLGSYQLQDDRRGQHEFGRMMRGRVLEVYLREQPHEVDEQWKHIRRGWCLGDEDFRREMEEKVDERISRYDRRSYLGDAACSHDALEAERLLGFGLNALGVTGDMLTDLKKNDLRKRVVAWLVRNNTSVRNDWICDRLAMGRASNLARYVNDIERSTDPHVMELREMMKKAF